MTTIDAYIKRLERGIVSNLLLSMRAELIPLIVNNLMKIYDEQLVGLEPDYDPAKPSVAREAFKSSIQFDLETTLWQMGGNFSISAGDPKKLGYDKHTLSYLRTGVGKNPEPLSWLIFYLEGFIGNFYFVTKEDFDQFKAAGKVYGDEYKSWNWGWYGKGFLIPEAAYKKRGFDKVSGVQHKLHPFSGVKPVRLFEHAMDGIDFGSIVDKAIDKALKG